MKAVVGDEAMTDDDKIYLEFKDAFENEFIRQDYYENRSIQESLGIAWKLLKKFPRGLLKKIDENLKDQYLSNNFQSGNDSYD